MDRFQVALTDVPGDETKFIASVRVIGKVSLADAVEIHAEALRVAGLVLVAGIERATADHIAATFIEAGTRVTVQPSTMNTPMVCRPQAGEAFRWTALRNVVPVRSSD